MTHILNLELVDKRDMTHFIEHDTFNVTQIRGTWLILLNLELIDEKDMTYFMERDSFYWTWRILLNMTHFIEHDSFDMT